LNLKVTKLSCPAVHITPPQAYRILESLAAENKLKLDGKGRYAKYVPF
jgi:hypothetical protein